MKNVLCKPCILCTTTAINFPFTWQISLMFEQRHMDSHMSVCSSLLLSVAVHGASQRQLGTLLEKGTVWMPERSAEPSAVSGPVLELLL